MASLAVGLAGASAALASPPSVISAYAGTGAFNSPTPGPATSSALRDPFDVAVDSAGDVYIADSSNAEVEKVTPSGTLSVIAGTGTNAAPTPGPATSSRLGVPSGLAIDASGDLFIADVNNNDVEKVTPSGILSVIAGLGPTHAGPPTPGPATSSELHYPDAVAVDSAGDVYIADDGNNEIEKITPSGTLSVIAGTGTAGPPTSGPATSSDLNNPYGVAVDASGDVYIADNGNNEIEKITPSGTLSVIAGTGIAGAPTPGPATGSRLSGPSDVTLDSGGEVYVADAGNNEVEKITPSGTLSVIAGTGTAGAPTFGGPATSSKLGDPSGLAVDSAGDVYLADDGVDNRVVLISQPVPTNLVLPQITGTPAVGATLSVSPGTWFPTPTGYTYQWLDCDGSGDACTPIAGATAGTYTLTSADAGFTIRVLVTATDPNGPANSTSAPTASVPTPPTITPTTVATATQADAVTVTAATVAAGLMSTHTGHVSLPLTCPAVVDGTCDASGTLSTRHNSVIARFTAIQIDAGQQAQVATKLSAKVIRYLRAHHLYRVRVTLSTQNALQNGQIISSTQRMWLYVSRLTGVRAASGTISTSGIGSLRLGMTRARAQKTGDYARTHDGFESYFIAGGTIRVAYASRSLVRSDPSLAGRVIIALTGNRRYQIHGIRAGMTVQAANAHLHLGTAIVVGKNAWYLISRRRATFVLKVENGVIDEIGVTRRALTGTRAQDRFLLHHL